MLDSNSNGSRSRTALAGMSLGLALALLPVSPVAAATLKTLHTFSGSDGRNPEAALILGADGRLYGTTRNGGVLGPGTLFRIRTDGNEFQSIFDFAVDGVQVQGVEPTGNVPLSSLVMDSAGKLYGTTSRGNASAANEFGTVFSVEADGSNYEILFDYSQAPLYSHLGARPIAGLVIDPSRDRLFGVNYLCPYANCATVFQLFTDGREELPGYGSTQELYALSQLEGRFPRASLVLDNDGNLYGTASAGGSDGNGSVFKLGSVINLETQEYVDDFKVLHSFGGADGDAPFGSVTMAMDGNLYGTTRYGGSSNLGTVFRLGKDGSGFQVLHSFSGIDGSDPWAGLLIDTAGNLFGTTSLGGIPGGGVVFRIGSDGDGFTVLYSFGSSSDTEGLTPLGALIADAAGHLYGTTSIDGDAGFGTVFRLSDTGFVVGGREVIPEPATWALLIAGFGLVGGSLRARRRRDEGGLEGRAFI